MVERVRACAGTVAAEFYQFAVRLRDMKQLTGADNGCQRGRTRWRGYRKMADTWAPILRFFKGVRYQVHAAVRGRHERVCDCRHGEQANQLAELPKDADIIDFLACNKVSRISNAM